MKTLCLFVLILLIGSLSAQSGYIYDQELASHYGSRSIFVCSENSVVVLGNVDNTQEVHEYDLAITKVSPYGSLVWRRYMGNGGMTSITGVDIDASDTVTFITTLFFPTRIQLWTIDSEGQINPISDYITTPYLTLSFNKALRTPTNEIIAVGKTAQNIEVSSACYFRFSATGDTLSTAFWSVDQGSQNQRAQAYDLAMKENGNLLVTCTLFSGLGSVLEISPSGTIVTRIDLPSNFISYGTITINRDINDISTFLISHCSGVNTDPVTVYTRYEDNSINQLFVLTTNQLQIINTMIIGNGFTYLCGWTLSGVGVLVKVAIDGEILWSYNQLGDNNCIYLINGFGSPSTALLGLDGDGCVYWAWGGNGHQMILKLLPNGQVPVEDEVQLHPQESITAYPNPMKDNITIRIEDKVQTLGLENCIEIYNIKGQKIRSLRFNDYETQWDGKDNSGNPAASGIYFVRIESGGKSFTRKVMLIK
jgi:hypothetical protein